jgi:hypothetical protein
MLENVDIFVFIFACRRFDCESTKVQRRLLEKLAPIRALFERFVRVEYCIEHYTPAEYMTIDEKLEAFRGRCGFRQAKWPYFQSLLFLKDQFIPRRSTSNLASTSSCANPSPLGTDSSEDVDD